MLEKVIENWTSRLDYIRASRGSPMPEIIFKITFVRACGQKKVFDKRHNTFLNRPITKLITQLSTYRVTGEKVKSADQKTPNQFLKAILSPIQGRKRASDKNPVRHTRRTSASLPAASPQTYPRVIPPVTFDAINNPDRHELPLRCVGPPANTMKNGPQTRLRGVQW
ncbi:hypothetical protein TNCV_1070611 [Trichonephila clavipes]|nr:hypothetical protein TNCV_1070611 [Trichonephila clavipes]